MLRLSGRRVPFCFGKNRVRRAAAVQTVQNRLPRACGEKPVLSTMLRAASGSPPRVRGEAQKTLNRVFDARITPACAGRRGFVSFLGAVVSDHPRVCGEKLDRLALRPRLRGSPPRVRGEVKESPLEHGKRRITPACAGRSDADDDLPFPMEDHPRVCGEKRPCTKAKRLRRGSPPACAGRSHSTRRPWC